MEKTKKVEKAGELHIFLTAVMFYTRIPCPRWVDHSEHILNKSTKYFPLMGWLVGGVAAAVFWLCLYGGIPETLAVLLSIIATVWLTGAFHEDGFADSCDGFGGGWTREQILNIMKDSRLGTYGAIGLLLLLLLKFFSLLELPAPLVPAILLGGHSLSRLTATGLIALLPYAREDASSKVKPVAKKLSTGEFTLATFFGILPLLLLGKPEVFGLILPLMLSTLLLGRYFRKWLGGYTGDCLGATQQVNEVIFYLGALWIFT